MESILEDLLLCSAAALEGNNTSDIPDRLVGHSDFRMIPRGKLVILGLAYRL